MQQQAIPEKLSVEASNQTSQARDAILHFFAAGHPHLNVAISGDDEVVFKSVDLKDALPFEIKFDHLSRRAAKIVHFDRAVFTFGTPIADEAKRICQPIIDWIETGESKTEAISHSDQPRPRTGEGRLAKSDEKPAAKAARLARFADEAESRAQAARREADEAAKVAVVAAVKGETL